MGTVTYVPNGGVQNWSTGSTWDTGIAPTAADDVIVAANLAGSSLVIDGVAGTPNLCRSVNFTGYTRTLTHAAGKELDVGDGTTGAFTLVAGMTYAPAATSILKFVSTTTGNTIDWAGKNLPIITFDGVGGAWQFTGTAPGTGNNTITVTLTNGSLDTNGKNISSLFSSNNSNTRSLTLGATNWTMGAVTSSGVIWDISTSTGMTLSAGSSTITFPQTTGNPTFAGGGLTYGTVSETTPTTGGGLSITGSNTFGTLTLSMAGSAKTVAGGYTFAAGTTQTITSALTFNGNTALLRNFVRSSTPGTAATIATGTSTVTVTHTDFRDITATCSSTQWDFSGLTTTANGNCGGNTGITFTAPKNCYMKVGANANWSASNWYTTSGGSTAIVPAMPLIHDTAIFDASSITAGSVTITSDEARHPSMNWTGVTNSPTFTHGSLAREWYGDVIFPAGMSHTGSGQVTLMGRGSHSFSDATTWPYPGWILDTPTGTYTQGANFLGATSAPFTFTKGTWVGGSYTFTTGTTGANLVFNGSATVGLGPTTIGTSSSYTTTSATGTHTLGGTLTLPSAGFAISSGTLDMNGYGITGHTTATISGTAVLQLSGQVNGSGAITVSGGTINDTGAAGELKGTTASFTGGTSALRKMTLSSTFAMSSTSSLQLNPGTFTYATSWTETGTAHTLIINGTSSETGGVLTVTAAGAGGGTSVYTGLQGIENGV